MLLPIEVEELGSVWGKTLLHLQCHIGTDTLSWARRGARVTGVDFSAEAIAQANKLAERAEMEEVRFIESEVSRAAHALPDERFDIVFTSWGVLGWLPDLDAWARTIKRLLKPGGVFYIAELHPTLLMFDGKEADVRRYPYFRPAEPLIEDSDGSYADRSVELVYRRRFEWVYELGQVLTALADVGLRIQFLHEHDGTCCQFLECLTKHDDGLYRLPEGELSLPLSFSIRAIFES